ncbi:mechanosensitive ion channel domain-containing protein [Pseudoalteromonas sp. BDTF-M6]|uniref:mechanosensitive ion channel family protein n=1 Tax=Pseudoalteromonas sp. BDTF-M6 TaxID=2796132 RepID=UPI001BAF50AF|nr:mechanosensitive ion channel domain-containing protein [Pseudoalteromonas sp. BDTF-M6]MBS3796196.1 mechanosensitive ion channel [Pseudoalteromonas sp. BDTF-M6]
MLIRVCLLALIVVSGLCGATQGKVTVKEILQQQQPERSEQEQAEQAQEIEEVMLDKLHRETPRGAMQGYLNAARTRDFALASDYLDFRNLGPEVLALGKPQLAEILYLVLDRTLWVDVQSLSSQPQGKSQDLLPSYRDLVGELKTSQGPVQILLQRVPADSGGDYIWKISNATVAQIPLLKEQYSYSPSGEWLYKNLPDYSFLGVKLWQWVYYSANLLVYLLLAFAITRVLAFTAKRIKPDLSAEACSLINGPLCLLLGVILARNLASDANSTLASKAVFEGATLLIIAWTWFALRAIDVVRYRFSQRLIQRGNEQAVYLLRPLGNVVQIAVVIMALFLWLENLGFSATTLVAGLGIGGLAVALAAQKSVENIIGAITLYSSAPVRVGQVCRFGEQVGTVEEIGLRATRVRTLNRTVIHVPNARFVDMELENISERERIAYRPELILDRSTTSAQISALQAELIDMLTRQPDVADNPCRVRFTGFVPRGLCIEVLCYIETTDFNEYLTRCEALNLAALSLLHKLEIDLAPPEYL